MTRCSHRCCRGRLPADGEPAAAPRLHAALRDWRGLVVVGVLVAGLCWLTWFGGLFEGLLPGTGS